MNLEDKGFSIKNVLLQWMDPLFDVRGKEGETFYRKVLLALLIFAFLIRIPLLFFPEVIHNDGTLYVRHARQILAGEWIVGKSHPFYPALIALAHFFSPNDEIAGIWVSVILGTLLVFPVFYLGKAIFNERVGLIAALFATVHPFLTTSSGSVLTESTFHFLLATSVLFGWKVFLEGRFLTVLLFSLFVSFSYLTRPESIGFLLILSVWVLLVGPPQRARHWTKRIGIIVLALFAFIVFSFPYLLQIKKETGRWQISKKVSISIGSLSEEQGEVPMEMIKVKKKMTLSSLVKSPLSLAGRIGAGILESLYKFQQVYTPLLSLLLLFGLILSKGRGLSIKGNLYLVSFLLYFFGLVHPFFWITRRFTSHVIAISLPWAAFGFLEMARWSRKKFNNESIRKKFPAILLSGVILLLFLQGRILHPRDHRLIQKEAGLWMKDHLPREVKLMAGMPQEAFYAELPWVRMPKGSYEEVLKAARSEAVRFLIINEKIEKDSPGFLEKSKGRELIPVKTWQKKSQWVTVLEMASP